MVFEEQKESAVSYMWSINGSSGVIGMLSRAFDWFGGITTEATAAFRADDGRKSRFHRRKRIHHDIFDPVGMATRTAAVFVPAAGIRIESQELVHDRIGHRIAPQRFLGIICTL